VRPPWHPIVRGKRKNSKYETLFTSSRRLVGCSAYLAGTLPRCSGAPTALHSRRLRASDIIDSRFFASSCPTASTCRLPGSLLAAERCRRAGEQLFCLACSWDAFRQRNLIKPLISSYFISWKKQQMYYLRAVYEFCRHRDSETPAGYGAIGESPSYASMENKDMLHGTCVYLGGK
jgi:hypothetical protein